MRIIDIGVVMPAVILGVAGCAQVGDAIRGTSGGGGIDRAVPIAILTKAPQPLDELLTPQATTKGQTPALELSDRNARDNYIEQWMAWSDAGCQDYKAKIIAVSRNERLATDLGSGLLSGLATIFTKAATIHPLSGAATILTGFGGSISADTFAKETGDVIASAIDTARQNQANQIEINLRTKDVSEYPVSRAARDVVDYHGLCSLGAALTQIKSSLKQTSPDAGTTPTAKQGEQVNGPEATLVIAGRGFSKISAAKALQNYIFDSSLSRQLRVQHQRDIENAAVGLGFTDVPAQGAANFATDTSPGAAAEQEQVARRLDLNF